MAARVRTLAALEHLKLALLHHVELARAQAGVALLDQDLARLRSSTSLALALSCSLILGRICESSKVYACMLTGRGVAHTPSCGVLAQARNV